MSASQPKELRGQGEYRITGVYHDEHLARQVRANLRKLSKMTKANDGLARRSRFQR